MPRQFSVAGAALKPFCVGHSKLLKFVGLPFGEDEKDECSLEDMILCASICALTYEQGLEMIHSDWPLVIKQWRHKVLGRLRIFRFKKFDEEQLINSFREYVTDGYRMPPLWIRPVTSSIQLTSPRELLLVNRLSELGYSTVMNMYLPDAWYQYFSKVESTAADKFDGDIKNWRRMFFTQQDAMKMEVADGR